MLIAIVAVLGQLRLVICPDPRRRQLQRIAQIGCKAVISRLALRRVDLPACAVEVETIEPLRHFDERNIAAVAHRTDAFAQQRSTHRHRPRAGH